MAYHFSANQFEDQYNARKLGNWEYPKWYPERPRQRTKPTKIIANDNGHLLEGIKRENPWGTYLGTWDLPRRITRDFAQKLAAPPERVIARWQKKKVAKEEISKPSEEQQQPEEGTELCKRCCSPQGKCTCDQKLASESLSDEIVKCGESPSCPKCENAVCLCSKDKDCSCSDTYEKEIVNRNINLGFVHTWFDSVWRRWHFKGSAQTDKIPKISKRMEPVKANSARLITFEDEQIEAHLPLLHKRGSLTPTDSFQKRNRSSSALDLRPKLEQLTPSKTSGKDEPVKSDDLTEKVKAIIDSVQEKQTPPLKLKDTCKEIRSLPPTWKEKSPPVNECDFDPVPKSKEGTRGYNQYLNKHLNKFELDKSEVEEDEEEKNVILPLPIEAEPVQAESMEKSTLPEKPEKTTPSYQIAKRYQEENLKHQPLPDVIEDPVFKALGSSRHPNPGSHLNLQPNAAAIGWKGYAAPGPTQCSKMRIYRPKTAVTDQMKGCKTQRPKTSDPKLNKTDKHVSQMELAICWDLIPEDPSDEPKRSPHIDGSNGSVAPAVFSIVRPESREDGAKPNINASPQAVAERVLPDIHSDNAANLPTKHSKVPIATNKEAIMAHIKPPSTSPGSKKKDGTPDSLNSITSSAAEIARKNPKTAWTGTDTSKTLSRKLLELQKENNNPNIMNGSIKNAESRRNTIESDTSTLLRKKQYQSSPNLVSAGCQTSRRCSGSNCGTEKSSSKGSSKDAKMNGKKIRSCDCCDRIDTNQNVGKNQEKSEFKSAFKAGVPNNGSSHSSSPPSEKPLKIPKMRLPYAKRSYSISTLIPPFSLWPGHGQDYPDHWRLASVYQHSYKPIDYRKKSLLASIYQ